MITMHSRARQTDEHHGIDQQSNLTNASRANKTKLRQCKIETKISFKELI